MDLLGAYLTYMYDIFVRSNSPKKKLEKKSQTQLTLIVAMFQGLKKVFALEHLGVKMQKEWTNRLNLLDSTLYGEDK